MSVICLDDWSIGVTYLGVEFKSTVWSEHHNRGWTKWIFGGEKNAKMIEAAFKFSATWTTYSAMPFLYAR